MGGLINIGWSNYVVIPKLKLLIEITRDVSGIEDYECDVIDNAINEDNFEYAQHVEGEEIVDIEDVTIHKITIKDLAELHRRYDIVQSLTGIDRVKLLLYWLKSRSIEFSIESEHNIDIDKYNKEGYVVIRR